jgi:hypothetical protein
MATQPTEAFEPDIDALVTFLREESVKSIDESLNDDRATALDFYNGEPFGDEEEGRSQVVTRDVAETIDYMTVSLWRTLISGDRVVEFDYPEEQPQQPPQQAPEGQPAPQQGARPPGFAEQATAAVSQEFFQGQRGAQMLHDWIKAGLLEKTSTAKVCVEPRPPKRTEGVVSSLDLASMQQQGIQIVGAEQVGEDQYHVAALHPQPPKFRDYIVPNEECGVAPDARDMDEDCVYNRFTTPRTLSQLAQLGFDTDDLSDDYNLANSQDALFDARDPWRSDTWQGGKERQGANRKVWHHEEYCTFDLNGDGIAELLQVHRVGNTILRHADTGEYAIEEIDQQPGVIWCPFPMQHRLVGQSLADKVMDIQRSRSVLFRQALDNLYQSNAPRMAVSESAIGTTTLDDLLTVRAGGIVRYVGSQRPEPIAVPFVAESAFQVMEVLSGEKESRTGITRLNQGLDADTLNKTATGTALMQAQGQQIEEYLARNFAEAFARLMLKKYHLMRKFGSPMKVQIDGEMVMVDPRQWPEDMNVQVRVGLGSGRKDQRIQYRQLVMQVQQEIAMSESQVVTDENIWNSAKGLIKDMNLGDPKDFFTDPSGLPPQQPKPDPNMVKVQNDAQLQAMKQQADQTQAQSKLMLEAQQAQHKASLDAQSHQADIETKQQKAALEAELARDKATFEANLASQTADRNYQLSLLQIERDKEIAKYKVDNAPQIPQDRPGGNLAE